MTKAAVGHCPPPTTILLRMLGRDDDLPHFSATELALGSLPPVPADTRPILADAPIHAAAAQNSTTTGDGPGLEKESRNGGERWLVAE